MVPSSCIADDWCGCFKPGSACGVLNNLTSQQVQDMQDIKASMRVKQSKRIADGSTPGTFVVQQSKASNSTYHGSHCTRCSSTT